MNAFDRFASAVSSYVARARFFVACVLLVLIWAPTMAFLPIDTSQLIINTVTTIITFLMVALLQNTTERFELSVHEKLDDILERLAEIDETDTAKAKAAIGAEKRSRT